MEVKHYKEGEVVVIEVSGKLDTSAAKTFESNLFEVINQNEKNILVDCSKLVFIASSGLRVFLMGLKHMNKTNGKFSLCALNELIYEVFDVSGFTPIFTIYDTKEEALENF
jgi:anti-anti-sigma factor